MSVDRKVNSLLDGIAVIWREARGAGASDGLIDEMCEPYYDLLRSILLEDYPLAKAIEESELSQSPEQISVRGDVREMDLDSRRFKLKIVANSLENKLACVYRDTADNEAAEWFDKQVVVTGFVLRDSGGEYRLLAVEKVEVVH